MSSIDRLISDSVMSMMQYPHRIGVAHIVELSFDLSIDLFLPRYTQHATPDL